MIRTEEISDASSFRALGAEWEGLRSSVPGATPFLSHDWFECCVDAFGEGRTLRVILARRGKDLVGAAPLWSRTRRAPFGSVSEISFIGGPETPYADFLIARDGGDDVAEALIEHVASGRSGTWDLLILAPWPEDSPHRSGVERALRARRLPVVPAIASQIPRVLVSTTWEDYWQSRSVQYRKGYRRIRNRIRELPNLTLDRYKDANDPGLWRDLIAVSERSWKAREGIAIVSQPGLRRFFERLLESAAARGWLLVWILRTGDRPIAMEFDLEADGVIYAIRADFDEELDSIGPGRYLEVEILEHAFRSGYREYSCGPGVSTYKLRLTDRVDTNRRVTVCNRTPVGRAWWLWRGRVRPWLRSLKHRDGEAAPATREKT